MTLAFESPNLTAAVAAIQKEAAGERFRISARPNEAYDSADPGQVQAYLLQHAQDAYAGLEGQPTPGLIVRVPYRGLGIVFGRAPSEWSPGFLVPANARPLHIAVVWQMLS
jgi:hypothetical protein